MLMHDAVSQAHTMGTEHKENTRCKAAVLVGILVAGPPSKLRWFA